MSFRGAHAPELVPQLSRGKHRNARKGACFMEMASYLAGERWSDHPACTHPLLAALARFVNDHTSDAERAKLIGLVPSVIGLTSDDPHVDVEIALRAATTALPVVSAERQRVLAVGVLAAERVLSDLDGRPPGELQDRSRRALAEVPDAAQWARSFHQEMGTTVKGFRRHGAPGIVRHAVVGIAQACVPDPDELLRDLLAGAISDCATWAGPTTAARTRRSTHRPVELAVGDRQGPAGRALRDDAWSVAGRRGHDHDDPAAHDRRNGSPAPLLRVDSRTRPA